MKNRAVQLTKLRMQTIRLEPFLAMPNAARSLSSILRVGANPHARRGSLASACAVCGCKMEALSKLPIVCIALAHFALTLVACHD
jgi:hypothetical protein